MSVNEASDVCRVDHADVHYTPTGGSKVGERDLTRLREEVLRVATAHGFPGHTGNEDRAAFDCDSAILLHTTMNISANEATRSGVWEFLTCVLLCDVVRWRFPGDSSGTPSERMRGGRRNAFQRLWWRGRALEDATHEDPYHLLRALGEDELVQIMERPFLAGSARLARAVARQLLDASDRHSISRRVLIRESQKYLRRLGGITSFDALDTEVLNELVAAVFEQAAVSPTRSAGTRV